MKVYAGNVELNPVNFSLMIKFENEKEIKFFINKLQSRLNEITSASNEENKKELGNYLIGVARKDTAEKLLNSATPKLQNSDVGSKSLIVSVLDKNSMDTIATYNSQDNIVGISFVDLTNEDADWTKEEALCMVIDYQDAGKYLAMPTELVSQLTLKGLEEEGDSIFYRKLLFKKLDNISKQQHNKYFKDESNSWARKLFDPK